MTSARRLSGIALWLASVLAWWAAAGDVSAGALSETTYRRLEKIQALMAAERFGEAEKKLQSLAGRVREGGYEYAVVMQTWGYLHAAEGRYRKAVAAFRKALETGALPDEVVAALKYDLAQLYAGLEEWKQAARAYEAWLAETKNPSAESYAFGAMVYAQLERYGKAIGAIRKAISKAQRPREAWYQLLAALHYQRNDLKSMARVLEKMVTLWPGRARYWKQLAGVHHLLGRNRRALAVLALAYRQGFLNKESELLNLVELYLMQKIPYKAARILEREMAAGRIRRTGRNRQRLGEIWMQARETEAAIDALEAAARARKDGRLHLRLARLWYERERWAKVVHHARRARALGGLRNPGDAWLLEGMALYERGETAAARAAFERARAHSESRTQAAQWLAYLEQDGDEGGEP